jgi:hypothetical protein
VVDPDIETPAFSPEARKVVVPDPDDGPMKAEVTDREVAIICNAVVFSANDPVA